MDVVLKKKNKKKVFANLIPENGLSGTPKGLEISEERRQKQLETHWARKLTKEENPNFGLKRSELQRQNMRAAQKEIVLLNGFVGLMTGRHHTESTKAHWSSVRKGKISAPQDKIDKLIKLHKEILELYETKPQTGEEHKIGKIQRNGRIYSYDRSFAVSFSAIYGITSAAIYNIIKHRTKVASKMIHENI